MRYLVESLYGGEHLVQWSLLQVVVVDTVQHYVHLRSVLYCRYSGQWTVDSEQWPVNSGQWTVDSN